MSTACHAMNIQDKTQTSTREKTNKLERRGIVNFWLPIITFLFSVILAYYQFIVDPRRAKEVEFRSTFTNLLKDVDYEYRSNLPEFMFRLNWDSMMTDTAINGIRYRVLNKKYLHSDLIITNRGTQPLKFITILALFYDQLTDHDDTSYNYLHTYEIPNSRYLVKASTFLKELRVGDSTKLDLWKIFQGIAESSKTGLEAFFPGQREVQLMRLYRSSKSLSNIDQEPFGISKLPAALKNKQEFAAFPQRQYPWSTGFRFKLVIDYTVDRYNVIEFLNGTCLVQGAITDRGTFKSIGIASDDVRAMSQILFRPNREGEYKPFRLNKSVYNDLDSWDCTKYHLKAAKTQGTIDNSLMEARTIFVSGM